MIADLDIPNAIVLGSVIISVVMFFVVGGACGAICQTIREELRRLP